MRTRFHRPHWSYSSLNQYLRCPLQYFFERVLGLPRATVGSGLVLGSAVHTALEHYHRGLMENQPASRDQIQKSFIDAWGSRDDECEIEYKRNETRSSAIELGVALVEMYLEEPPPENIVAVEQSFLSPLRNSQGEFLETPLAAVADLLTQDNESLKVREFKTSGRAYSEFETDTSLQPTAYVNAVQHHYNAIADVEYTVLVKTKTPKIQRISAPRTEDDLGRLGDIVESVEKAVQAKAFYPIESPLNCSTCPFRSPCREWGRPLKPLTELTMPCEAAAGVA